jgi:hypothetical protein
MANREILSPRELHLNRNHAVLCQLLRTNDPKSAPTRIALVSDAEYPAYPVGYFRRLAVALRTNTTVTSISLEPTFIIRTGQRAEVDLLLEYIQNSKALEDVDLTQPNESGTDILNQVFDAMANNSRIIHLGLYMYDVRIPHDPFFIILRTLKTLEMYVDAIDLASPHDAARAFGTATNLCDLCLHGGQNEHTSASVLRILPTLPHLAKFTYIVSSYDGDQVAQALEHFLSATTSLRHLKLQTDEVLLNNEDAKCLIAGLSRNTSITELTFGDISLVEDASDTI